MSSNFRYNQYDFPIIAFIWQALKSLGFSLNDWKEKYMQPPNLSERVEVSAHAPSTDSFEVLCHLFATWLTDELEEVTHAIVLGGDTFKDLWGTPHVIGKFESRRSDIVKGPTSIVSALINTDPNGLVSSFGQACAYKLFSHKSYLALPCQTASDELIRMQSICQIFGIGLVTFNNISPTQPDFQLMVRATKHEPDLFYTNWYVAHVEKELFA